MQITTILYFFAAAVYVGLGLRHWSRDRRDAAHRLFLGICLCFALWSFGCAMLTVSENLPARSCWRRVGYAGAVSYEVFILLFFLRHTGILGFFRTRWFVDVSLWLIPAAFLYANIFHNAVHEPFPDGFWYIGLHVMANTYNFTSIAVIALWMRRTPLKREKKQAGAIIVAGFVTIVVTLVCDFVMGLAGLPTLSPVLILIWIASISFAAKRYRFLGVTPKSISSEVLDQIGDFVAVSDTRGLLILASKRLIQRTSNGRPRD